MGWKNYLIMFIIIFQLFILMAVACNFSVLQLARITGEEIKPPFIIYNNIEKEMLKLDIMDNNVLINYSFLTTIQNFFLTVKFNVIPRVEYVGFLWKKGVGQLVQDVLNFLGYLRG